MGAWTVWSKAGVVWIYCNVTCLNLLQILMGYAPFQWTITRLFTTDNLSNSTKSSVAEARLELDEETAAVRITTADVDCSETLAQNETWPLNKTVSGHWTVPHVQVYSVSARDRDGTTSNMLTLTVRDTAWSFLFLLRLNQINFNFTLDVLFCSQIFYNSDCWRNFPPTSPFVLP